MQLQHFSCDDLQVFVAFVHLAAASSSPASSPASLQILSVFVQIESDSLQLFVQVSLGAGLHVLSVVDVGIGSVAIATGAVPASICGSASCSD